MPFLHALCSVPGPESDMKCSTYQHLLWLFWVAASSLPSCPCEQIQTVYWCLVLCCGKTTEKVNQFDMPKESWSMMVNRLNCFFCSSFKKNEGDKKCFLKCCLYICVSVNVLLQVENIASFLFHFHTHTIHGKLFKYCIEKSQRCCALQKPNASFHPCFYKSVAISASQQKDSPHSL